ncbi:hypothetical protein D9615_006309 [Tricholomella constricta]|uniref:GH16 domain-containing protein n=1 Tax=Tricholomella constricta TaxID=117010 RepID=A0A8H5GTJ4_9AGAR|nr:hypothetical protein D9615_010042 [Tricholomella constricta]KAF5379729.1 hypothetical protein D9615_005837 [Tricholomella constricta]KAF5380145.1 hypothetical protein D9615_006309 [Tricholomella constricta]
MTSISKDTSRPALPSAIPPSGQIINPVQSARISTKRSASTKFGKVEVRAKIPKGDWQWPAIWMLPVDNKYGPWPLSGEIDIMEATLVRPLGTRSVPNRPRDLEAWRLAPGLPLPNSQVPIYRI